MEDEPRVFISYSWDSQDHKDWVRRLADRLIGDGLAVTLDQYDLRGGQDMHVFMERGVCDASHVLVVCTPDYIARANARRRGVGEETSLITPEFYNRARSGKEFVPVIRRHGATKATPDYLASLVYVDFSDDALFDPSYDKLLRILYNEPEFKKPQRGKKPSLHARAATAPKGASASVAALRKTVTESSPTEWQYDDDRGVYVFGPDARFQIRQIRNDEPEGFVEPWVQRFPDPAAFRDIYELYYDNNYVEKYVFVAVDGFRMSIPLPKSSTELEVGHDLYSVGTIINLKNAPRDYDEYLARAGIRIGQ